MSKIQFQLEVLDGLVPTLQSMAGEHQDMSASLGGHAAAAQSIGADGWIVDQLRYASSLLGSHPDLFRQLASELGPRLELAHKAADVTSGGPTALRAELMLVMTATTGLLKAATESAKANQRVQLAAKKSDATLMHLVDQELGTLSPLADVLGKARMLPEDGPFAPGPMGLIFATGQTAAEIQEAADKGQNVPLAAAKAGARNYGGLAVGSLVGSATGAVVTAAGAPAIVVGGAALAMSWIGSDVVSHTVDGVAAENWTQDYEKHGVLGVLVAWQLVKARVDQQVDSDIGNTIAGVGHAIWNVEASADPYLASGPVND